MATTLLTKALGTTAGRWRGLWLAGFAVPTGLVIDLTMTYWLKGLPSDSFWIVWPILALIILTVSLLAAVLRRLVGPLGIFLDRHRGHPVRQPLIRRCERRPLRKAPPEK
jgi:hypothetical protein